MIDFHSHVLPKMDDGSGSVEESIAMLRLLREQGVEQVVATPHFYAERMTPETFLTLRNTAEERLQERWESGLPHLVMGAEVAFFEGIGHSVGIERLCLAHTNTLLLEMPFVPWTPRLLDEVENLRRRDLRVVLAHVERYLPMQSRAVKEQLFSGGLWLQMNGEALLSFRTRRLGLRLLENGRVHVLGSDCHGVRYRPPQMAQACEVIRKRLGQEILVSLEEKARELLMPMAEKATI